MRCIGYEPSRANRPRRNDSIAAAALAERRREGSPEEATEEPYSNRFLYKSLRLRISVSCVREIEQNDLKHREDIIIGRFTNEPTQLLPSANACVQEDIPTIHSPKIRIERRRVHLIYPAFNARPSRRRQLCNCSLHSSDGARKVVLLAMVQDQFSELSAGELMCQRCKVHVHSEE